MARQAGVMPRHARIIDAAARFLRTNPELLAYARAAAPGSGMSVAELLEDAVARVRAAGPSAVDQVAQQQVILRSPGGGQREPGEIIGRRGVSRHHARA
jgi:hypothetical protein